MYQIDARNSHQINSKVPNEEKTITIIIGSTSIEIAIKLGRSVAFTSLGTSRIVGPIRLAKP
jgi:hypothetical protein